MASGAASDVSPIPFSIVGDFEKTPAKNHEEIMGKWMSDSQRAEFPDLLALLSYTISKEQLPSKFSTTFIETKAKWGKIKMFTS